MVFLLCTAYFIVLFLLTAYGLHRSHLVWTCLRNKRSSPVVCHLSSFPYVTIQLPLYNEATVAARLLEYVSCIDYPRDRLEIQVLDDSTDETQALLSSLVQQLRRRGIDAIYMHRAHRVSYKAGALDAGLKQAKGELIAIFDADFLPQPDFLKNIVPHFSDATIGMVQARWGHLNRNHSLLTRIQALMLDGHHLVENRARASAQWLFNFSGTGGVWRKRAIEESGGWQNDTLTEDLDLSYRAQLAGWRFVYREDIVTQAELPETLSAFRTQQYRWAKGTVQTARKLLGRVLTSQLTRGQRIEAFFHLTPHFAYPLMTILSLLLLPALVFMPAVHTHTMLFIDLPLCVGTTGSLAMFYITAEVAQGRQKREAILLLPALLAIGAGLAPYLTRAVLDGLFSNHGEFVRTPKSGMNAKRYQTHIDLPWAEIFLSLFSCFSIVASLYTKHWFAAPFACLFAVGYGAIALLLLLEQRAQHGSKHASSMRLTPMHMHFEKKDKQSKTISSVRSVPQACSTSCLAETK